MNSPSTPKSEPLRQILPPDERSLSITPEQIQNFMRLDNPGPYPMFAIRETEFSKIWTIDIHHHLAGITWKIILKTHQGTLLEAKEAIESALDSKGFVRISPLHHTGNELQCLTSKTGWTYLA